MTHSTFNVGQRAGRVQARMLLSAAIVLLGQAACGGGGGDGTPTPPATPEPTVSISVAPTSITAGGSATLTWSSTNATACTASGAWTGAQQTSGTSSTGTVATAGTDTYTLSCNGAGGSGSGSATLTVTAAVAAGPTVWVPDYGDSLLRVYVGAVSSQPQPITVDLPTNCTPNSVAVNAGSVYVVCGAGNASIDQILVYQESAITSAAAGAVLTAATTTPTLTIKDPNFSGLVGSAFDGAGDLFVASGFNNEVLEFTAATLASDNPVSSIAASNSPYAPAGVAFDSNGSLWVTGYDNPSPYYVQGGTGYPILLGFAKGAFGQEPTYCITTDPEAGAGCQIYPGATTQYSPFNDLEGVAIDSNGIVYVANNGASTPGYFVYQFTTSPPAVPGTLGGLIDATYLGNPANANNTANGPTFECPGGLFATAAHLWVNDEGYNDAATNCGSTGGDTVSNGSGGGTVFYLTPAQITAEDGGQPLDPSTNTNYLTGRPGFGGIYVENDN